MSRFIRLFAFAASFMAVQPAFADRDHDNGHGRDDQRHHVAVPELSAHGAAAGLALIAGAAAVVLGRRRARRA